MAPNPYDSPPSLSHHHGRSATRIVACGIAWILCFLIPAFAVILVQFFARHIPDSMKRPLPTSDDIVARTSILLDIPADIVLPASLIGCAIAAGLAPIRGEWRFAIFVAWFPLIAVQVFVILLGLCLARRPPT
jgi:hypothetical protein